MLTPQEVSERSFTKATFGGYNMAQVDEFLDILTGDYSALYSENAVLKSKMKVLADKVEEYRSTEDGMRKALVTAQRIADEMVSEAEQKKADVLRDAESEAEQKMDALKKAVEAEELRLRKAQEATAAFVAQVRALQDSQSDLLNNLEDLCPETEEPQEEDPITETANEIDDNVQRLLAQAISDVAAANQKKAAQQDHLDDTRDLSDTAEYTPIRDEVLQGPAPREDEAEDDENNEEHLDDQEEEMPPKQHQGDRIDFGDLQFGRDYEIK